ncbi:lipopolysaccharide core heptose(I) kinase RfaP [Coraliomargarita sinensis]|nr:lipopolysaccharide core heptose(I) kinase RfaP [Coraliomargarita sinensis]
MYLDLDPQLQNALEQERDVFEWFLQPRGQTHREVKHRLTYEVNLGDLHIFVKRHLGCGWKEVIKEWYRFRKPVVSARNEWEGASILNKAGLRVPKVLGKGERGRYPHAVESFVALEALENCENLEHFKKGWLGFEGTRWVELKQYLVGEIARITRTMHRCGINHRDLYINHFLVNHSIILDWNPGRTLPLYLIDLHRVQKRKEVPARWLQKDLSALLFSALDVGLTSADCVRFLKEYLGADWKKEFWEKKRLWTKIVRRAIRLYNGFHRKPPTLPKLLRTN